MIATSVGVAPAGERSVDRQGTAIAPLPVPTSTTAQRSVAGPAPAVSRP